MAKVQEIGCFVCALKNIFKLQIYLGCLPLNLKCIHTKGSKHYSVNYDSKSISILIIQFVILLWFMQETIFKIIELAFAEDFSFLATCLECVQCLLHTMALVSLFFVCTQTSEIKNEIQGFYTICNTYGHKYPLFTKITERKLTQDSNRFNLFLISFWILNYLEVLYNLITDFHLSFDECFTNFKLAWSSTIVFVKFYMFISNAKCYFNVFDEHHNYLRKYILDPKWKRSKHNSVSACVDRKGKKVFVRPAIGLINFELMDTMIEVRKVYSAFFCNFLIMNEYHNPSLITSTGVTMSYAVVNAFVLSSIIIEGYEAESIWTRSLSFLVLMSFIAYMIIAVTDLYYVVSIIFLIL